MTTINREKFDDISILRYVKFKTHPDLLSGNKEFIDPLPLGKFEIPESTEDLYHEITISNVNRLDNIAAEYYGSPQYWWVLALVNDIFDPQVGLRIGDYIRIPALLKVLDALREFRQKEE